MWLFNRFSSSIAKYATSDKSVRGDGSHGQASRTQIWYRIISNLIAGGLVALSLLALAVVMAQGVFHRDALQYHYQDNPFYWSDFGKDCLLDANGFVPNTCTFKEINVTATPDVWRAIGIHLGTFLQVPKGKRYPVSVCWQGATSSLGWATLELLVGYDYYPQCCPQNKSQPIAGFINIESTSRIEYPEGVYLLTGFADKLTNYTTTYTATDGTENLLVDNMGHSIITLNGSIHPDIEGPKWGMTSVIPITPLGRRYTISSYNIASFFVITDTSHLAGWSTGLHSKLHISPGWICGHEVDNYEEIFLMQVVFSFISIFLFWGDIYITAKGLQGVLHGKPVLTYDVLSGLERRKFLMFMITLNSMPSILYIDVARIYYGTDGGLKMWGIAVLSLSVLSAFVGFIIVTLIQYIPPPPATLFHGHRVITFSAPVFLYISIISVNFAINGDMHDLNIEYNNAPSGMGFWAHNQSWTSGIYIAEAPTAIHSLVPKMWAPVVLSLVASIIYSELKLVVGGRSTFASTEWMKANTFLFTCGAPRWITSMPVAAHNAIKIGNRWFCKPSTQVLFGYVSVEPIATSKVLTELSTVKSEEGPVDLISIYDLGWTILCDRWFSYRPRRIGVNMKNKFVKLTSTDNPRLSKSKNYTLTRGSAID
ncbi:hypothetical protein THRCLA_20341 [Thraustotheca clavata]|uniref:Transmembrane protein n=1 Tax=Thraustotheca clavata TaxID=74557 RepID=A0A1W0A8U3_9STRA|nr:hypothetical protein THRCLA_20341 [Thraustotheca clavata]